MVAACSKVVFSLKLHGTTIFISYLWNHGGRNEKEVCEGGIFCPKDQCNSQKWIFFSFSGLAVVIIWDSWEEEGEKTYTDFHLIPQTPDWAYLSI